MSEQQSPFQPPPGLQYATGGFPRRSAGPDRSKWASTLMWVIGGFMIFVFGMVAIRSYMMTPEDLQKLQAEQQQMFASQGTNLPPLPSPNVTRWASFFIYGAGSLFGLVLVTLAFGVRQKRHGQTLASFVLTLFATGLLGLFFLVSLVGGLSAPLFFGFACMLVIPLGMSALLSVWLLSVLKSTNRGSAPIQWQPAPGSPAGISLGYATHPAPVPPPQRQSTLGYAYPAPPPSVTAAPESPPIPPPPPADLGPNPS